MNQSESSINVRFIQPPRSCALPHRTRFHSSLRLRQLRRNALKEQEAGKAPKNFRAIFQVLQELDQQGASHDTE